jgi:hypothetical protein
MARASSDYVTGRSVRKIHIGRWDYDGQSQNVTAEAFFKRGFDMDTSLIFLRLAETSLWCRCNFTMVAIFSMGHLF